MYTPLLWSGKTQRGRGGDVNCENMCKKSKTVRRRNKRFGNTGLLFSN